MLLENCSKFARNVKYCSNVAQSAKKYSRVLKMQNSAPDSKKSAQKVLSAIGKGLAEIAHKTRQTFYDSAYSKSNDPVT